MRDCFNCEFHSTCDGIRCEVKERAEQRHRWIDTILYSTVLIISIIVLLIAKAQG